VEAALGVQVEAVEDRRRGGLVVEGSGGPANSNLLKVTHGLVSSELR